MTEALPDRRAPRPVTAERVAACLEARGYVVARDEDGDLTGIWGSDRFWFLLLGRDAEILQVRGRWHRTLPAECRGETLLVVNDWNRERLWPKVYVRTEGGSTAVYAEVSVDLEHGANDDQLDLVLRCGLSTAGRLFSALEQQLPDAIDSSAD